MRDTFESLDLLHLRILAMLLTQRSVSQVAERTGHSQPAMSRILQRLRRTLGDPLLVRSGIRLVPTERAEALLAPLQSMLSWVPEIAEGIEFDAATSLQKFRIACADCLPPTMFAQLIRRLGELGPGIRLELSYLDASRDVGTMLDDNDLDLVISNSPTPREDLHLGKLFSDPVVCLMRAGHPLSGSRILSLPAYLKASHLSPFAAASPGRGPIDGALAQAGKARHIGATVPEFNLAPEVLLATDLLFTTGLAFATHYERRYARLHDSAQRLTIARAPSLFKPMQFYQQWHPRSQASVANRWLRQQTIDALRELCVIDGQIVHGVVSATPGSREPACPRPSTSRAPRGE